MSEIILPTPFKVGRSELSVLSFMVRELENAPFFMSDISKGTRLPPGNVFPVIEKYIILEVISSEESQIEYHSPINGLLIPRRTFRLTEPGIDCAYDIITGYFLPKSQNNALTYIRH